MDNITKEAILPEFPTTPLKPVVTPTTTLEYEPTTTTESEVETTTSESEAEVTTKSSAVRSYIQNNSFFFVSQYLIYSAVFA